ncbi:NTP transferase domain-containing protein, partial [Turicimonas muris]|uniref:NTP transferase domain-containing protein n=1 Tax=Turicimonas muris TaxID=1796652 RepID=UPI00249567F0
MNVVILAAGKGKRMNSFLPKVLQRLGNKPMLEWVLDSAETLLRGQSPVVVIGHGAEQVREYFADRPVKFALQA